VVGIKAYADMYSQEPAIVISSEEEVLSNKEIIKQAKKIGIVIQTTQKSENFKKILPIIAENSKELKIHNTICSTTFKRQQEAQSLAQEVELMVVVGSKSSANTTNLAEILSKITKTLHIETSDDLDNYNNLLCNVSKIGITAGASTPESVINDVINRIGD
jgi:4-hydroxy-3-methylbut-2-enyl diphosphate reductase